MSCQICPDSYPDHGLIFHASTKAQNVHVISFTDLLGSVTLSDEGRAITGCFVSGETKANTPYTNRLVTFHFTLGDHLTSSNKKAHVIE
jgi:hypothetical protein